jgi:hypothetical protein
MVKRVTAMVGSLVLLVSTVGASMAAAPGGFAVGRFQYHPFDRPALRTGSIAATTSGPGLGKWQWQDRRGPITCLVIEGSDAWLAGPGTTGPDTGVWIHVHDGGNPGTDDDMATAWGQDPGQPLEELRNWCETQSDAVPLFPVVSGNVTVRDSR